VTLLDDLTGHTEDIARDVLALCQVRVTVQRPTAQAAVTELAEELARRWSGRRPERIVEQDRPALLWAPEPGGVLLLGHLDTVWPTGTLARWPRRCAPPTRSVRPGSST